jgi:hypothetical protein
MAKSAYSCSMRTRFLILASVCVAFAIGLVFAVRVQESKPREVKPRAVQVSSPADRQAWAMPDPTPNGAHDYKDLVARLAAERIAFASRYRQAATRDQQANVIAQARTFVTRSIYAEIFPSWYGTPWDFNGTTEIPRQGKIACGYFVSTVLRDAGWKVQRTRLAQQASENIILSLTIDSHVQRFRRVGINDFVAAVEKWGAGIYVVGLDIHTGFIVNTGADVYFIHSSYIEPYTVIREKATESKILASSNYRVLGKITADDQFIEKWLLQTEIVTRTT